VKIQRSNGRSLLGTISATTYMGMTGGVWVGFDWEGSRRKTYTDTNRMHLFGSRAILLLYRSSFPYITVAPNNDTWAYTVMISLIMCYLSLDFSTDMGASVWF
jgi:hypothetical protein